MIRVYSAVALGCGLVGKFVIERLLEREIKLTVLDLTIPAEISQHPLVNAVHGDVFEHIEQLPARSVVINMLPGRIGDGVRPLLLKAGHQIVDLAFTAEDPSVHQQLAIENSAVLLWDIGIAPGISNMLAKKAVELLGPLESLSIKVGGNPTETDGHWSYMAPFSPSDVIDEYTRPARIKSNNDIFEVPALGDRHIIQVEGYGEMEAFLTDGLRSILATIPARNMKEYTIRWPGHIDKWLESSQLFYEEEVLEEWKFDPSRSEFTWLEVVAENNSEQKRWVVQDTGRNGDASMARTTGLVTAACAILFLEKGPTEGCGLEPGIHPPEAMSSKAIEFIIEMMTSHGVEFSEF